MRITQETDYAFRIVSYLAENEGKVVVDIAAENNERKPRLGLR